MGPRRPREHQRGAGRCRSGADRRTPGGEAGWLTEGARLRADPNRGQSSVFFVGAAEWGWDKSDDAQTRLQMRGIEMYGRWFSPTNGWGLEAVPRFGLVRETDGVPRPPDLAASDEPSPSLTLTI